MKVAILTAGKNIYGRIYANELREFKPKLINEIDTENAKKLSLWLDTKYLKDIKFKSIKQDLSAGKYFSKFIPEEQDSIEKVLQNNLELRNKLCN